MKDLINFPSDIRNSFIGYNSIIDDFFKFHTNFEKYPLDNIVKIDEDTYRIEIAVAGFKKDELEVERLPTKLVVRGTKTITEEPKQYLRRNIAARSFEKSFMVSEKYDAIDTALKDGILSVLFKRKEAEKDEKVLLDIK